jgi:hypothetical protein
VRASLWLAFADAARGTAERELADLLRLVGMSSTLAILGVSEQDIRAWAEARCVPARHHAAISAASSRARDAEGGNEDENEEPQAANRGQWALYRAAVAQGHGSYAEIAARFRVTKQAVGKAIAFQKRAEERAKTRKAGVTDKKAKR